MKEKILEIIIAVAGELNDNIESKIPIELGEKAALYGSGGGLSSLELVSLIVGVEQAVEEELGVSITLADEKAFSLAKSPFRTIGSLAEYASSLIDGN